MNNPSYKGSYTSMADVFRSCIAQTAILDLECKTLRESIARIDGMIEATRNIRMELQREPEQQEAA